MALLRRKQKRGAIPKESVVIPDFPALVHRTGRWMLLATALTLGSPRAGAADTPALVISGGTVFNSVTGTMERDQTIVIKGERIQAVGPTAHLPALPSGARQLDARGKFILPGLIDAHAHLVIHVSAPDGRSATQHPHLTAGEILPLFLANGVTALRNTGDDTMTLAAVAHYARSRPEL